MTGGLTNYGTIQNYSEEPYVSVASFRAAPTWLDSDDLIPGGTSSKQDNELFNVLLRATSWADLYCGGGTEYPYLGASLMTQNMRTRSNRFGEIKIHPAKVPLQYVSSIYTGADPLSLSPIPNIAQLWIEDNRQIVIPLLGNSNFTNLQFGGNVAINGPTYVELNYVAGYFNSTLASGTYNQGTTSVTMNNAIGLIPGTVFRINDPGSEEVCAVGPSYTQGSDTVPLASPLLYTHTAGAVSAPGSLINASALPMAIQQGIISYAVGLLLREDTASTTPFAQSPMGPPARRADSGGKAGGLIAEAEGYLSSFKRVR
jgi:hypothetical protein